jgi:hypothetical protein
MTPTLTRLAFLLAMTGCAGAPAHIEAPQALTSSIMGKLGSGVVLARQMDAEAHFAQKQAQGEPLRPGQPGYGFDRPLANHGQLDQPTDADVARLLDARQTLRAPARLACVEAQSRFEYVHSSFFGEPIVTATNSGWSVRPPTPADLRSIRVALDPTARESLAEEDEWPSVAAPQRHVFASITAIPGLFLPGQGDLGKVRYAAARIGCDALLVYARATRVYTFRNGLANLYPTLVGLALPGNERIVVTRVEGAIVDVRTGHVFCVAQGESRQEASSSPLFASSDDERRMVEASEAEAALRMTQDLSRELAQLEAAGRIKDRPVEASK